VGDGPERPTLLSLLAHYGVRSSTVVAGAVAPQDIPGWLASMDVGVAPYPQATGFYFSPLKVYEYMAAGRPVVASRVGQVARLVQDGVTGLLCPPGDATALAGALTRLYRDSPERERMGRAGRELVLREHTWDAVVERILRIAGEDALAASAAVGHG
jgi:glycosyltransferase involved in cell wall biosynthesis